MMEKTPVIMPFKFVSFAPQAAEEKKDNIIYLRKKIEYTKYSKAPVAEKQEVPVSANNNIDLLT